MTSKVGDSMPCLPGKTHKKNKDLNNSHKLQQNWNISNYIEVMQTQSNWNRMKCSSSLFLMYFWWIHVFIQTMLHLVTFTNKNWKCVIWSKLKIHDQSWQRSLWVIVCLKQFKASHTSREIFPSSMAAPQFEAMEIERNRNLLSHWDTKTTHSSIEVKKNDRWSQHLSTDFSSMCYSFLADLNRLSPCESEPCVLCRRCFASFCVV